MLKKVISLFLAIFSLLSGLLIAEFTLRLIQPQPVEKIDNNLYMTESSPRYRLNPGYRGRVSNLVEFDVSVSINGSGFRGEEIGRKSDDEKRLLVVGDSFVFGWGVEADETFAAKLAEGLWPTLPGIRVINGGVPGYGPVDIVDWVETFGVDLEPDLVLVCLFLGNDLIDATEKHRQINFAASPDQDPALSTRLRDRLYRGSHLVRLVKRAIPSTLSNRVRGWFGLPEPWATTYLRDLLESYAVAETELARQGREASVEALGRLAELARKHDFNVLIALLPGPLQTLEAQWQQGLLSLGLPEDRRGAYDPHRPAQIFQQLTTSQAWPVFDLTVAFQKAAEDGEAPMFFRYDPHWTPAGHALAAKELRDFILSEELRRAAEAEATESPETAQPSAP